MATYQNYTQGRKGMSRSSSAYVAPKVNQGISGGCLFVAMIVAAVLIGLLMLAH